MLSRTFPLISARIAPIATSLASFHATPAKSRFKSGRGTGDQGKSSLFNNERRWKDDDVFLALGTVDELNSLLGASRQRVQQQGLFDVADLLYQLQCCLQDVGAHVATPPGSSKTKTEKTRFDPEMYEFVNKQIDVYGDRMTPLKEFILPGGGPVGSSLQIARSVCRRAERTLVPLLRADAIDRNCIRFLNRLSDLLFVLGRYSGSMTGHLDDCYQLPMKFTPLERWKFKTHDEESVYSHYGA
ncbi:hypothetical protein AB6A40_004022 [Gnathostoma spinigerum]|uniref:Corrinoid adenosyltransferase MMAB n=1 Tax=Gnathostoma spinigerum TaxID=75299 RepID=A0ABD6EBE9_9BILA